MDLKIKSRQVLPHHHETISVPEDWQQSEFPGKF